MAAVDVGNQFPVPVGCAHVLRRQGCLSAKKIRKDISFRRWLITTSCFRKRTAAMLKFYFRLKL